MKYLRAACQQCGGHIEFPAEAVGQKVQCPHCGWETELLDHNPPPAVGGGAANRRRILFLCVLAAVMVLLAGVGVFLWMVLSAPRPMSNPVYPIVTSNTPIVAPKPEPDPWDGLKAGPIKLDKPASGHLVYAVGVIRNTTARQRFGVKVEVDIFDSAGKKLDSATDYIPVIEPKKEWHFRAMVVDQDAARAELRGIEEQK